MDAILSQPTEHCHAPNLDKISVIKLQNDIKSRAVINEEPSANILHSALRNFPLHSAGALPRNDSLTRSIRRQRQPEPLDELSRLPNNLIKTHRGEDFILHEDKDLIIFTTKSNLSVLKSCKHWFADGTFKVCPDDFYQLFTLHGLFMSHVIPLVYGLLIGKSADDYNQVFEHILKQHDFTPETFLTDFESGTLKSVRSLFPNILHKGCLFHYGQCVWREVQNCCLTKKYHEDKSFHLNIKKLIAIAFVPVRDVIQAFELLENEFDNDADEFIYYFETTWIGERKKRGNGRKKPLFVHELWNVYDRVVVDLPRSNNAVEGWHNAFANRVLISHPSVSKLANKIRQEQSKFEIDIEQVRQGHEPKPRKASYRKLDDRIKRLVQAYDNNDLAQYLNGLAANVTL